MVRVRPNAKNDVARCETFLAQTLKNGLGTLQRDGVAVDQANPFIQDLVAVGGQRAAESVPQALDGAFDLRCAQFLQGVRGTIDD